MKRAKYQFEIFHRHAGWFWHLRHQNGRIVADGAESYASRRNVVRAIERFASNVMHIADAAVVEVA